MNTISKMCEAPLLKGKTSTTPKANPSHLSPLPSLGSTSPQGSAPPEGGESKYPGVLMDLELGGVWVGEGKPSLDVGMPPVIISLYPSNNGSWKLGCGFHLPPQTSHYTNPTPYYPVAPAKIIPSTSSTTPTKTIPSSSYTATSGTIRIRTATGGTRVITKQPKKTSSPVPTYVCDGIDCTFATDSPYDFINHQKIPHHWKPGSQNWCLQKAKALAKGNKPVGIKASCPTIFASVDVRVKKGEIPPNVLTTSCSEEQTLQSSKCSTISPSTSFVTPTTDAKPFITLTLAPSPISTTKNPPSQPPISTAKTLSPFKPTAKKAPKPTLHKKHSSSKKNDDMEGFYFPQPSNSISFVKESVLYFPVSYFLWKRQLPTPASTPVIPPWHLFPRPKGKKVASSSHLKWDRRLPNKTTYCWGVNDPNMGLSSHPVTLRHGVGIPKFQENGNWARYSNLLVPKSHQQHTQPFFNSTNYIRPKRRVPRPKSGQNTAHKGHGMSKGDILKGLGKSIPCEVSCSKKINNPFSHIQKPLITSTLHWPSSISTSINISTNKNTSNMPLMVSYPSKRTKWERSPGGSLRGGGPTTPITIRLMGSIPKNYEGDHRKLTITCQDSVVECSLFVIEYHSEYTKNMLHECGNCR